MPEEREVNTTSGVTEKFNIAEIYDENITPERLHALAVEILDRGVTHSRFQVHLPPHLHGEWVPRDAIAVREYQSKGFKIDHEFANNNAIKEQSGEHGNVIGDVIFMTCPMNWKNILDAEKHKRFVEMNGSPSDVRKAKAEENSYTNEAKKLEKYGIGNFQSSETRTAPASELNKGAF